MSGFFDPPSDGSGGPMQQFPGYDGQYSGQYHRLGGPSSHYDAVAFWYRPEASESIYEHEGSAFNGTAGTQPITMEAAKHRRTRSGCFTCRMRRVKCDETKPICDRCRKGRRECGFPPPTSSKRVKSDPKSLGVVASKHQKQESKDSSGVQLETIQDEDDQDDAVPVASTRRPTLSKVRTASTQSLGRKQRYRHGSEPSPIVPAFRDKSSPQSASSSSSNSHNETPTSSLTTTTFSMELNARQAKIVTLNSAIQLYLQFQREHLTHYHYFFKVDPSDWIHTGFLDEALAYEPLLHAVVGFAAYHYEVRQPNAKLSHFLQYHSKALSMLRQSLESGSDYTPGQLLTVLQLATFEECLGDWVNLVGHHRAAHSMLNSIYTPETIMDSENGRMIFTWFARMDVIASLMGGKDASLDRVWYEASARYCEEQVDTDPENDIDIDGYFVAFVATNRLIGYDMAKLYAKVPTNKLSIEDFEHENSKIVERLQAFRSRIEALNDGYYAVQEFPMAKQRPLTDEDIVDPYKASGLYRDALWPLNFMWIDWYAIDMMQQYQTSLVLKNPVPPIMEAWSTEQCRIYEAVARWPQAPAGAILGAHASIALAAVFLKKDERHTMWIRRKLANVERLGYVFPPHYRAQMARVWGLTNDEVGKENSVEDWWLPNDEGKLPILGEIRKVVDERNRLGENSGILGKEVEDVRDISAIFAKLDVRSQRREIPSTGARRGSFNSLERLSPSGSETQRSTLSGHGTPGTAVQSPASAVSGKDENLQKRQPQSPSGEFDAATIKEEDDEAMNDGTRKDPNRMSGIWSRYEDNR